MSDTYSDEELLERLRGVIARFDPMPDTVATAARASFAMASLESDLAALTFDSWVDAGDDLVLMRSPGGAGAARQLTFQSPDLVVELQESAPSGSASPGRSLVGQLVPPAAGRVEIRHRTGLSTVEADPMGRFLADGIPGGPISLRCMIAGRPPTDTEWVVI